MAAKTDPLGMSRIEVPAKLRLDNYGFTPAQLSSSKPVDVSRAGGEIRGHGFTASDRALPLLELHRRLTETYSGSVGVEYMHIKDQAQRDWLRDRMETVEAPVPSAAERRHALKHLCWADSFASFCSSNFKRTKRFGLEGCESLVVGMNEMVERAGELGAEYVVMGMPHRGRLNVLANVARKPLVQIFRDFRGAVDGTPVENAEWRAMIEATFEQLCSGGRDGRLEASELHGALRRLGVPASASDANSLVSEWAADGEASAGVSVSEFHALTRSLLFPRSVSGDVKVHLGLVRTRALDKALDKGAATSSLTLELLPNPSHLEAVNPLVSGRARAIQQRLGDTEERTRCVPLVVHGDAAFAAQGVVYETLGLSHLRGYTCGGTVHVIINNQIGFTTPPAQARSSRYCSDVAKIVEAPIFHVNGDDVDAVVRVCQLAIDFRQRFHRDIVVDLVCYRKNGHQEADNPAFTQPAMCARIAAQSSTFAQYSQALVEQGVVTAAAIDSMQREVHGVLGRAREEAKGPAPPSTAAAPPTQGATIREASAAARSATAVGEDVGGEGVVARDDPTGVRLASLLEAGRACTALPPQLGAHRVVRRLYEQRARMLEPSAGAEAETAADPSALSSSSSSSQRTVDWATAEALAFATLLTDGVSVRLSGQDAERGTFSQRHAVVHDQAAHGHTFTPLGALAAAHGTSFEVHNSPLSEFAVLGFELGHSLNSPDALVLWEAQFGDFANTAQCVIDQFLCAGEAKWLVKTGLVLLLPHGMEGAGPEHSSARLERFLQLCDDDERTTPTVTSEHCLRRARRTAANLLVANLTTPANYFHALRRQVAHPVLRKPLILMAPKGMLRDPRLSSPIDDLLEGRVFEPVLAEPRDEALAPPESVRRLLLCSGRLFFDLEAAREDASEPGAPHDVAIVRIEQLSPFPYQEVREQLARWPNAQVVWAQEEPMNYGAWSYVRPRLENTVRALRRGVGTSSATGGSEPLVGYVGRNPSAAPATGLAALHQRELEGLLEAAFAE